MRTPPSLQIMESRALRRQQAVFCVLTLFLIAVLLLLHTLFASVLGEPSEAVVVLLGVSFSIKALELIWLQGQVHGISQRAAKWETCISILGAFLLTAILAYLTDRDDAPYFALLAIPILQSAYHCGWEVTVLTIAGAIGINFFWIGHYFLLHPPPRPTEYLETGMISIIYTLMGLLVWLLVNQLKHQQARLYENMAELEETREKFASEEKLAAVGRLASGIAHEIRNPVAMISSSLATAVNSNLATTDRAEMVQIAAREAARLERLTTEFLNYARPSKPQCSSVLIGDLLSYVADVVKAHANSRGVEVQYTPPEDITVEVDSAQVQGALLNLALNGIDSTKPPGSLEIRAFRTEPLVQIDVRNTGEAIKEPDLPHIFEPFYSTKPSGTGLGLPIARRVAQSHGGELWVSRNQDGSVVFSMTISDHGPQGPSGEM